METKYKVSRDQFLEISNLISNIMQQLSRKDNCPVNPDQFILILKKVVKGEFKDINLISINSDEPFKISACLNSDFNSDLANFSGNRHDSFFSKKFLSECCSTKTENDTAEIEVDIKYVDAISPLYKNFLDTLEMPPRKVCMTQHQIVRFCLENEGWLRTRRFLTAFIFLTKKNGRYKYVIFINHFSLRRKIFTEYARCLDYKTNSSADFDNMYFIIPKI